MQRNFGNVRVQMVQLGGIQGAEGKALELSRVLKVADVQQPKVDVQRGRVVLHANDDEKTQLQQRVAELEKRVKELEAELARAKARK
jgi:polyhydroxyalkanoate synthesis regulator phasin